MIGDEAEGTGISGKAFYNHKYVDIFIGSLFCLQLLWSLQEYDM